MILVHVRNGLTRQFLKVSTTHIFQEKEANYSFHKYPSDPSLYKTMISLSPAIRGYKERRPVYSLTLKLEKRGQNVSSMGIKASSSIMDTHRSFLRTCLYTCMLIIKVEPVRKWSCVQYMNLPLTIEFWSFRVQKG